MATPAGTFEAIEFRTLDENTGQRLCHHRVHLSIGFGWTSTDRDLRLLANRYPGREPTVRFFNKEDDRASQRATEVLPEIRHADAIHTGHGMTEAVAEGVHKLGVDLLFHSRHLAAITPQTKAWIQRDLPELVKAHPVHFADEPPGV